MHQATRHVGGALGHALRHGVQAGVDRISREPVLFQYRSLYFMKFGLISATVTFMALCTMAFVQRASGLPVEFSRRLFPAGLLAMLVLSIVPGKLIQAARYTRMKDKRTDELRSAAFTFFGGISGIVLVTLVLSWHYGVSALRMADSLLGPLPLFHGLSRLACLNYGCCYGHPLAEPHKLHVTYQNERAKASRLSGLRGVPLCPVQLYELAGGLLLQALLVLVLLIAPGHGYVAAGYFISYGVLRHFLQKHRNAIRTGTLTSRLYEAGLTVAFLLGGLVLLFFAAREPVPITLAFELRYLRDVASLMPLFLLLSLAELFVYGVHYKQVGRWL